MSRSLRTLFGERQIKASVDRLSADWKTSVILRQVNVGLRLATDCDSPLLQGFFRLKDFRSSHPRHYSALNQTRSKPEIPRIKANSLRITSENRVPMAINAEILPLGHLRSHARPSGIPRTGSANAHHACVSLVVFLGNTKVTPRENAQKIILKKSKKLLTIKLCVFMIF